MYPVIPVWNKCNQETSKDFTSVLATYISLCSGKTVTLLENEAKGELIGHQILGPQFSDAIHEARHYIAAKGAGGTITDIISSRLHINTKSENVLSVINNGLYYIPQIDDGPRGTFDEYLVERTYFYIEKARLISDLILIDTAKLSNSSTPYIIEIASKIIVIMPESLYAFESFFNSYSSIIHKCLFVIIQYQVPKRFYQKLKENFGLTARSVFAFRRTDEYEMYRRSGRLMDYVRNNVENTKESSEQSFFTELKRLTGYILNKKTL